jgi:hypothetical protein
MGRSTPPRADRQWAALVPLDGLDLPTFPPTASDDYAVLRAVWQTASGRVFVFGVDGIVLEVAGQPP